ncbi:HNH endonuclease signature motif containing protein [Pseudomonas sp. BN102]|uniref:HNH endonuclease n=1 Tax=Pseudomonas sp. BN102 TaxID=2567886 RepID=UPI002456B094|nr:HNH endonuclease signature motif containing protein [Pseudomonas sp. BN102]
MQRRLSTGPIGTELGSSLQEYRQRSAAVHLYATLRANGQCEGCNLPAPFSRPDGRAFLEVHHMTRLADDGPDMPANVAALCPNCHRRAHYSSDRKEFGRILQERVTLLEQRIVVGQGFRQSGISN